MMDSRLLENYKFPETINSQVAPSGSCEFTGSNVCLMALSVANVNLTA